MPKISWAATDDGALTADDIDQAEDGFTPYAGDLPPGGVYRFKLRRMKFKEAGTGTQGINALFELDGGWKKAHAQFDGCPMWDTVWMTKGSAAFAKAFGAALGVTAADLVSRVVTDEDGFITRIGKKTIKEGMVFYILIKRGTYNDEPRLERSGTGYQVVESSNPEPDDDADETPAPKKTAKATAGKAAPATTGKKNKQNPSADDDDEPPF